MDINKEEVMNLITSYKKSAAFIGAYKVGLFQLLYEGISEIELMEERLSVNKDHLTLLMYFLESLGLVNSEDQKWFLTKSFYECYNSLKGLSDIMNHEENLFKHWIQPDTIDEALAASLNERKFEQIGFTQKEQYLY